MKNKEFNNLWVILENIDKSLLERLPEKLIAFIKDSMDPNEKSDIDATISLQEQKLSSDTKSLLAALNLTYWVNSDNDRWELADRLHRNEMQAQGKPLTEISEEEYQGLLASFDDWNQLFGPIPNWAQSRRWQPETIWEIVAEKGDIEVEGLQLKEVYLDGEKRKAILEEARQWILVAHIEEEEELYWHDNDESHWSSEELREDFYRHEVVIRDGHFFGTLIHSDHHWGMGMASYRNQEYGLLGIDGTRLGRLDDYESRSSDETSYSKKTTYYLRKKQ
ncbi:MAG: hypothetical protein II704_07580 [Erysipelotrichaceae bacterium]|nr:hypothetical protein [Erysipelotrichaceae bacterium]